MISRKRHTSVWVFERRSDDTASQASHTYHPLRLSSGIRVRTGRDTFENEDIPNDEPSTKTGHG